MMKKRGRALRRAHDERIKAKAYRRVKGEHWSWPAVPKPEPDPRRVGMLAATPTPCSCDMCSWRDYNRAAAKRAVRRGMV